jgi:hypothetical protein
LRRERVDRAVDHPKHQSVVGLPDVVHSHDGGVPADSQACHRVHRGEPIRGVDEGPLRILACGAAFGVQSRLERKGPGDLADGEAAGDGILSRVLGGSRARADCHRESYDRSPGRDQHPSAHLAPLSAESVP